MKIIKFETILALFFTTLLVLALLATGAYFTFAVLVHTGVIKIFNTSRENNMDDPEFRKRIEQNIGFQFPESAKWEKSYWDGWLEEDFYCKFSIPKKDLETMFPESKVTWLYNDPSVFPRFSTPKDHWFAPEKLTKYKGFAKELHSDENKRLYFGLYVIVDDSQIDENEWVTVYIRYDDY